MYVLLDNVLDGLEITCTQEITGDFEVFSFHL